MKTAPKFDAVAFISNIIAVILGIAITFSVQGIIDRHNERENIASALQLVKDELAGCRRDLADCADFLDKERNAAVYLQNNLEHLKDCPRDSVSSHGNVYIMEMVLTLPDDALELLKSSSLFSLIDNNILSLEIIRAYDQCNAMLQVFNNHEAQKAETLKNIFIEIGIDKTFNEDGTISITEILKNKRSQYLTMLLMSGASSTMRSGLSDIDKAIESIENYLSKH